MSDITTDDVRHLAVLSNLQLRDDEIDHLRDDLARIVSYIDQLNEVDTDGVEPTYQVTGLKNVMRDDIVESDAVSREALLKLAPEQADDRVKVPQVL